jgi:transcriptional regulator with XRE-family HTH domain
MVDTSNKDCLKRRDIAYYRQRQKNRVFTALTAFFAEEAERGRITKKELARKLGKDPAQITRWLSAPSNFELDTLSDILLAMGAEMDHEIIRFGDRGEVEDIYRSANTASECHLHERIIKIETKATATATDNVFFFVSLPHAGEPELKSFTDGWDKVSAAKRESLCPDCGAPKGQYHGLGCVRRGIGNAAISRGGDGVVMMAIDPASSADRTVRYLWSAERGVIAIIPEAAELLETRAAYWQDKADAANIDEPEHIKQTYRLIAKELRKVAEELSGNASRPSS